MGIDFRDIRLRFQMRIERQRLQGAIALLNLLRPIIVKLASPEQKEQFATEWETLNQDTGEQWKSLHKKELFASVGLALSHWAGMEELLVAIVCLLLRTHEANKVGTILYSIINFGAWLQIIGELFTQEPLYVPLKPKWNKISTRLRALKDTRDRLAHHTIYYGDKVTTLAGDASLRAGRFDTRQKSQTFQPLDIGQIHNFSDSLGNVQEDLTALLHAMTTILRHETSQKKS
jgi:hypothetical protein